MEQQYSPTIIGDGNNISQPQENVVIPKEIASSIYDSSTSEEEENIDVQCNNSGAELIAEQDNSTPIKTTDASMTSSERMSQPVLTSSEIGEYSSAHGDIQVVCDSMIQPPESMVISDVQTPTAADSKKITKKYLKKSKIKKSTKDQEHKLPEQLKMSIRKFKKKEEEEVVLNHTLITVQPSPLANVDSSSIFNDLSHASLNTSLGAVIDLSPPDGGSNVGRIRGSRGSCLTRAWNRTSIWKREDNREDESKKKGICLVI